MNIIPTQVSKANINDIPFDGIVESVCEIKPIARVTTAQMRNMLSDDDKKIELRKRLASIWHEKTDGSYAKLEHLTLIKQNTFQKWMNGSRNPNRKELAKFVVGLSVNIETADDLFGLQDHALDCKSNRFDYIVVCAIKDGDDIDRLAKDVEKHCNLSLF